MNTRKTLVGAVAFVMCLWVMVVTTYATQAKWERIGVLPMANAPTSCSSNSGSGGGA